MLFERARNCLFFKSSFDLSKLPALPLDEIQLIRPANFWQFRYKYKTYTLAAHGEGILLGFNGSITPNKQADLLILATSQFTFEIYERRFTSEAELERLLELRTAQSSQSESKGHESAFPLVGQAISGRF